MNGPAIAARATTRSVPTPTQQNGELQAKTHTAVADDEVAGVGRTTAGRTTARPDWEAILLGALGIVGFVGFLQVISTLGVVSTRTMPPPPDIARSFVEQLGEESFWSAIGNTMKTWAWGMGLATAIAVPLGVLIGRVEMVWQALRPTIEFLRPIPTIAFIPIIILLFGRDLIGNVLLTGFACLWPLLVQVIDGTRSIDPVAAETLQAFGVSRRRRVFALMIPSAMPSFVTGVRIITAVALIVTITSELIIGTPGLGASIFRAQNVANLPLLYSLVLASGLVGVILTILSSQLERRLLHWHPSQRRAS